MSLRFVVAVAVALLVACSGPAKTEICNNSLDDDGNGKTDCADSACSAATECVGDAGFYGSCTHCGESCTQQKTCLAQSYVQDQPIPQCTGGRCEALRPHIQVRMQLDLQAYSGLYNLITGGSIATRFISKTAQDGSAVTCATLTAAAPGMGTVDAAQLEASNKFNLFGLDVAPLPQPGPVIVQPFVNVSTAQDFIIWLELWNGPRDTSTKLPTNRRWQPLCVESGAQVAPLILADDCSAAMGDAGTCRTLQLRPPAPM